MTTTYADIEPLRTQWLWDGRIARGEVTLIAGAGAVGKGQLLSDLVARVSRGDWMPGCEPADGEEAERPAPGTVIMVTPEDDPNETQVWRLRAAGADLSRVVDLTLLDSGAPFELPSAVPALRALIEQLQDEGRNPLLVDIDPLLAVTERPISTNLAARRVMAPLQRMAKETGVAVVMVHHTVKSGSVAGSKGLTDVLRYVYTVKRDPENDAIRVMHLDKGNNVGQTDDVRYTVVDGAEGPRAVWLSREELTERRTSWRKPAARPARPVRPAHAPRPTAPLRPPVVRFSAVRAERGPKGSPVVYSLGNHGTLSAAQAACQSDPKAAGKVLAWQPRDKSTWVASAPGVSFGVSAGRQ